MAIQQPESERAFLFITAVTAWFALIFQLKIAISNSDLSIAETVIHYFAYFKIWTNLLAAIFSTILFFSKRSRINDFFSDYKLITAIAVYISMGALIYNLIIRQMTKPEGIQWVLDMLLHTVVPMMFLFYWILFTPKAGLKWKSLWTWLLLPIFYIGYVLLTGRDSAFYPYPIFNVNTIGIGKVLENSLVVIAGVLLWSAIFVGYSKLLVRIGKT
jgi:hypothetical protein